MFASGPLSWVLFTLLILTMLALDQGVFHRKSHVMKMKEALLWTVIWISCGLLFGAGVFYYKGYEAGMQYLAGYVIEESLSVDNMFVFVLIFSSFRVPAAYQRRVLFWGILGALIMRGIFIGLGAALIERFHWILYIFGAFLVYTAVKIFLTRDDESEDPTDNSLVRLFRRFARITPTYEENHMFVKRDGKWWATPLMLVLVVVETSDLIFAVDSIPAIFAVTTDPFIVYTSNVFAILGLRSLYFLLAGSMDKFHYLKVGLSFVLAFVGVKMLISGLYPIPIVWSLVVICGILAAAIVASVIRARNLPDEPGLPDPSEIPEHHAVVIKDEPPVD
jgi:tellurite resistance protein TerC